MTKVYYVRHAEPNYDNHNEALRELTPKGLIDRKLVTEFLKDKQIDVVVSSPYKRAIDTIRDFSDQAGLEIEIIEDFRERKKDKEWIEDFESFCIRQWKDFHYKRVEGESLAEVQLRNINALHELLKRYPGKNIVIGGHGTALCTMINYFNPQFGYEESVKVQAKMPWILEFCFDEKNCFFAMHGHDFI